MLSPEEKQEIIVKGQSDGARLFRVVQTIYTILIVINWITGVLGGVAAIVIFVNAASLYAPGIMVTTGLMVLAGTAVLCLVNYAIAVLATHAAKVLVHILFANLALLSKDVQ